MAKPGFGEELARGVIVIVIDQDSPLQEAERAFDNAHVLVQHHMMDFGAVEQRANSGNQNEIVGPNQFLQINSPVPPAIGRPCGLSTASRPLPPHAALSIVYSRIVRIRQKWRPAWRLLYLSRARKTPR